MRFGPSVCVSRLVLACFAAAALCVSSASAGLFFADPFSYPDGQLTDSLHLGLPGDNVSGGLWTAHSGGGFDDNVAVIGGQAELLNSGSEDVNRLAGQTATAGDTWYYAALVTVNFTGDPNDPINNDYFMHFKDDSFGFRGRTYLDDPNTAGNDFTFGLSASSGGQAAKWATDLQFGTQYAIVVSYEYDTGSSKLWVDPVDEASTSISDTNGEMKAIDRLAMRQDFIGGTANNQILVDAVSIGDTFDEVLAGLAIPEPSSAALVFAAGLVFLAGRSARSGRH